MDYGSQDYFNAIKQMYETQNKSALDLGQSKTRSLLANKGALYGTPAYNIYTRNVVNPYQQGLQGALSNAQTAVSQNQWQADQSRLAAERAQQQQTDSILGNVAGKALLNTDWGGVGNWLQNILGTSGATAGTGAGLGSLLNSIGLGGISSFMGPLGIGLGAVDLLKNSPLAAKGSVLGDILGVGQHKATEQEIRTTMIPAFAKQLNNPLTANSALQFLKTYANIYPEAKSALVAAGYTLNQMGDWVKNTTFGIGGV